MLEEDPGHPVAHGHANLIRFARQEYNEALESILARESITGEVATNMFAAVCHGALGLASARWS